jgi:hypothetical protein
MSVIKMFRVESKAGRQRWVMNWNYERPHQGIGYPYPADIYFKDLTHYSG